MARSLTPEQELRADMVRELIRLPNPGRVVDIMFNADALTRFVLTREILGHAPAEEDVSSRRRHSNQAETLN